MHEHDIPASETRDKTNEQRHESSVNEESQQDYDNPWDKENDARAYEDALPKPVLWCVWCCHLSSKRQNTLTHCVSLCEPLV
jgi:hypothetical protein